MPPNRANAIPESAQILHHGDFAFLVSLQAARSSGQITLESADAGVQPRIDFNYLSTDADLRPMREAVRTAARLLRSKTFSPVFRSLRR